MNLAWRWGGGLYVSGHTGYSSVYGLQFWDCAKCFFHSCMKPRSAKTFKGESRDCIIVDK